MDTDAPRITATTASEKQGEAVGGVMLKNENSISDTKTLSIARDFSRLG